MQHCYNGQTAVDDPAHIIVAAELTNSGADSGQLLGGLAAARHSTGADPRQVVADAGYRSEAVFEALREHPAEIIVALGREGKKELGIDPIKRPLSAAMAEKFKEKKTQDAYRRRKWLSEPPNGWIKHVLGFRQFSMRGIAKAQAEFKLVRAALNLRRMAKMVAA